jgi:hypothetical protein
LGRHLPQLVMLQVGGLMEGEEMGSEENERLEQRWAGTSPRMRYSRWGLREGEGIGKEEIERVEA